MSKSNTTLQTKLESALNTKQKSALNDKQAGEEPIWTEVRTQTTTSDTELRCGISIANPNSDEEATKSPQNLVD